MYTTLFYSTKNDEFVCREKIEEAYNSNIKIQYTSKKVNIEQTYI